MKNKELSNKGTSLAPYASPDVKVLKINVQKVLCESILNTPQQYGTDTW